MITLFVAGEDKAGCLCCACREPIQAGDRVISVGDGDISHVDCMSEILHKVSDL